MAYAAASVFVVAVSLAALFAGGEACNNVASMTRAAACQQTDSWETLCQQTLQNAPDTAEVTAYALTATRLAKLRYQDTLAALDPMLGAGNLPTDERLAIDNCKEKYGVALRQMASVADQLAACDFSAAKQEYIDAEVGVRFCHDGLLQYQFLPLFAEVSADLDSTMVAYLLGAIIVGR